MGKEGNGILVVKSPDIAACMKEKEISFSSRQHLDQLRRIHMIL
jgi:hypothetical protein